MDNLPLDKYSMSELQLLKRTLDELRKYCHDNATSFPDALVAGIIIIVLKNKDYEDYYASR